MDNLDEGKKDNQDNRSSDSSNEASKFRMDKLSERAEQIQAEAKRKKDELSQRLGLNKGRSEEFVTDAKARLDQLKDKSSQPQPDGGDKPEHVTIPEDETRSRMNQYRSRVDEIQAEAERKRDELLNRVHDMYDTSAPKTSSGFGTASLPGTHQANLANFAQMAGVPEAGLFRVNMTYDTEVREFDDFFLKQFKIEDYYPQAKASLSYPVIYCETEEEYGEAFFNAIPIKFSPTNKEEVLKALANKWAADSYGVNFSGVACYINGYLFGKDYNQSPAEVKNNPRYKHHIDETVVHEKLGHGFLNLFSTLGQALGSLGSFIAKDIANFSQQIYSDPEYKLKIEKHQLLLESSFYQQEGWSTWIEQYFSKHKFNVDTNRPFTADYIRQKIKKINTLLSPDLKATKEELLKSIEIVLDDNLYPHHVILENMRIIKKHEGLFAKPLPPLRYVLGQVLFSKVERNACYLCVPHAALLAGNIKIDPDSIGLHDLSTLLDSDPLLNTDVRLVLISKLQPEKQNDVPGFAKLIEEILNMPVPANYKNFW